MRLRTTNNRRRNQRYRHWAAITPKQYDHRMWYRKTPEEIMADINAAWEKLKGL